MSDFYSFYAVCPAVAASAIYGYLNPVAVDAKFVSFIYIRSWDLFSLPALFLRLAWPRGLLSNDLAWCETTDKLARWSISGELLLRFCSLLCARSSISAIIRRWSTLLFALLPVNLVGILNCCCDVEADAIEVFLDFFILFYFLFIKQFMPEIVD